MRVGGMPCIYRMMAVMRRLVIALLAVEYQEIHAERIEGGDEHPGHHRKVGEAGA